MTIVVTMKTRAITSLSILVAALLAWSCSSPAPATDGPPTVADAALVDLVHASDTAQKDGPLTPDSGTAKIIEKVRVGLATSLPVVIELLTAGTRQFIAYYNKDRHLTVVSRTLGATSWSTYVTTSKVPWDNHNSIVMALDRDNQLHVAGNMHNVPLNYYRTTKALDVTSFQKVTKMVGTAETQMTYPTFLKGPKGELIFHYRDGLSGDGVTIFNTYDEATKTWKRLLDKPLFASTGMNAYPHGPLQHGGVYHVAWVWRDTPASRTTHDPSYARSVDLINWTKADGTALTLPLSNTNSDIVDPVPIDSGLENFNTKVSVDDLGRPVVSYHKWDAKGDTQLFNARFEAGAWKVYQTSAWKGRYLPGSSSSGPKLFIEPLKLEADGGLSQAFFHWSESPTRITNWKLDSATLKPVGSYPYVKNAIRDLVYKTVSSPYPGMRPASIIGRGDKPEHRLYFLRWEVVDSKGSSWPPPTEMHVYKLAL